MGDGDLDIVAVVVVQEHLGQHAPAGGGGGVVVVAEEVHLDDLLAVCVVVPVQLVAVAVLIGGVAGADLLAVDIDGQAGVAAEKVVVGVAADHVVQLALFHRGGVGAVGGFREGADLAAAQAPADGGAAELIGIALALLQVLEVILAELLDVILVGGLVAIVVLLVVGDLFGRAGDDHGAAVRGSDGGGAAAGVGHHVGLQGLEGHLGGVLPVEGVGQHDAGGGDAGVQGVGGHIDGPVGAHVALRGGVVAQSHQAHLGKGQAGQLALGVEGAVAGAGQNALLGAVADVASQPAVGRYVAEHHGVGGQLVRIIPQEHAADNGCSLLAGQDAAGVKRAAVCAFKDTQRRHDPDGFLAGDFTGIREIGGARSACPDNHHAHEHGGRQKQAESPFEVSHSDLPPSRF